MDDFTQPMDGRHTSQAVLGRLAYAPTITETVVTTRTITTIRHPPFVLQAPRKLEYRDPTLYPLATAPTPELLKKGHFDRDGKRAYFEEVENAEEVLRQYNETRDALAANNGTIQTTTTRAVHPPVYQPRNSSIQSRHDPAQRHSTLSTPPRSNDAQELASFHNRNKRPRILPPSIHIPENRSTALLQREETVRPRKHSRDEGRDNETDEDVEYRDYKPRSSASNIKQRHTASPRLRSVVPVAGSATPPGDESDYEVFDAAEAYRESQRRSVVNGTDASLPSPSLSPITAAANLNRQIPPLFPSNRMSPPPQLPRSPQTAKTNRFAPPQKPHHIDLPKPESNPQLPTPSLNDIPKMLEDFDTFPEHLKAYVLFQMVKRCTKPTLHHLSDAIAPALKCDFLTRLPMELCLNVVKHLDAQSLCRASQVSKKWRRIIDSDENLWWTRIRQDGYHVKATELSQAVAEGWGWQAPSGPNGHEEDLTTFSPSRQRRNSAVSDITLGDEMSDDGHLISSPPRKKRKGPSKATMLRYRKLRSTTARSAKRLLRYDPVHGPRTLAEDSKAIVGDPAVGLPSIRNHHLFKTLYSRHHSIRHSWMDPTTKPRHLAFRAHQRHVVTCLQFDQDKIITGSDDAFIDIYNTQTGESVRRLHGHEGGVWALTCRGNMLISGSTDRSVRIWDIAAGEEVHVFQGHTSTVRCLVVLEPTEVGRRADGKPIMVPPYPLIITGSRDSSCRVWRLPSLTDTKVKQTAPPQNEAENPYFIRSLVGHLHSVRAIAAHCDTLVSGSYDTTVRVWKISTGELIHRLSGHSQKVYSVVLDYDRNRCMSGSMDNLVKVWSLETGNCLFNLEGHTSLVGLLDLKDDRLVSAAADSTLRVWDPQNGRCVHDLSAHTGAITCFAHDGDKVISGSDRTLKMWNIKTGECVRDLLTDLSGVWQIQFDERRCVAAVQRSDYTYIEVLDFGAARDGVPESQRGRRIVVDGRGREIDDDVWTMDQQPQVVELDDQA